MLMIFVLALIYMDQLAFRLGYQSLFEDKQWAALRIYDFILSVAVLSQSRQLEDMLDDGD